LAQRHGLGTHPESGGPFWLQIDALECEGINDIPMGELGGAWTVKFDPKWGGPEAVSFERLEDWTQRPEPGIRYYSGKATYTPTFDLPAAARTSGK
jgi:hypothetical protein